MIVAKAPSFFLIHVQPLCRSLFPVKPLTVPLDNPIFFLIFLRQASTAKVRGLVFLTESISRFLAFTEFQIGRLSDLVSTNPDRSVASSVNTSNCDLRSSPATPSSSNRRSGGGSSVPVKRHVSHGTSSSYSHTPAITTFDDIAEEFGVRPDVVEALARRLSGLY